MMHCQIKVGIATLSDAYAGELDAGFWRESRWIFYRATFCWVRHACLQILNWKRNIGRSVGSESALASLDQRNSSKMAR